MKKGSWEAVFGHLGTPEEVAQEWERMQDENAKLRDELAIYKLQERVRDLRGSSDEERIAYRIKALKDQVGRSCSRCRGGNMFLDTNGYSYFLRCNTCGHVPLN